MGVKLRHAKFQPFTPRGTLSNWGLNGRGVGQVCVFKRKTGHISEMVRDMAKATIND